MRCKACNTVLSFYESTRKSVTTGEYIDLCDWCYKSIEEDVPCFERSDLSNEGEVLGYEDQDE